MGILRTRPIDGRLCEGAGIAAIATTRWCQLLADDDQMQYTSIDLSHYGFDTIDELLSYDDFENQFHKRMAPNI